MRITLMHNPKAGDAEHWRKQLMAALAEAGNQATYHSLNKTDYKKPNSSPSFRSTMRIVSFECFIHFPFCARLLDRYVVGHIQG
jgi:hypothetical protein